VSARDFYDGLAPDYHLVYEDWEAAVGRQGAALDRLIRTLSPSAADLLDCSCGIGTQAIGLARLGWRVHGTDISERSLERARTEATRLGADVFFEWADFRDLSTLAAQFDVVISCDNALPHLLTDDDLSRAFAAMRSKLRDHGLLVISVRDYDRVMVERPSTAMPDIRLGPPRRVIVRLHDWDSPDSPMHTVRFLVLTEFATGWTIEQHSVRYRAVGRESLTRIATAAGFKRVLWHTAEQVGFHQPVMTAFR
jgi:glycine/sarcosine N-methyltransferase